MAVAPATIGADVEAAPVIDHRKRRRRQRRCLDGHVCSRSRRGHSQYCPPNDAKPEFLHRHFSKPNCPRCQLPKPDPQRFRSQRLRLALLMTRTPMATAIFSTKARKRRHRARLVAMRAIIRRAPRRCGTTIQINGFRGGTATKCQNGWLDKAQVPVRTVVRRGRCIDWAEDGEIKQGPAAEIGRSQRYGPATDRICVCSTSGDGPLVFHADAMRQTAASARKHMAGRARAHGQSVREQHKQECCRRQGREKNGDDQEYFVAIHDRSVQPAQARRA